jgi:hypothetical protein
VPRSSDFLDLGVDLSLMLTVDPDRSNRLIGRQGVARPVPISHRQPRRQQRIVCWIHQSPALTELRLHRRTHVVPRGKQTDLDRLLRQDMTPANLMGTQAETVEFFDQQGRLRQAVPRLTTRNASASCAASVAYGKSRRARNACTAVRARMSGRHKRRCRAAMPSAMSTRVRLTSRQND